MNFFGPRARTSATAAPLRAGAKRRLVSFGLWLVVGFVSATLIGLPISRSLSQSKLQLERFDVDIYPAIDVDHLPPLIATAGEMVKLEFIFACGYCRESGTPFQPIATLYASYGAEQEVRPISLTEENHDGLRVLTSQLPASDDQTQPLRYYLEVTDPQFDLTVRYPVKGTVDLFVTPNFTPVVLPERKAVQPGELILTLPWGSGPEEAGVLSPEEYPRRMGPSALDVAFDGRIALLDNVKQRVLIVHPNQQSLTIIPVTITLKAGADVQFDRQGQVAIFDPGGERLGPSKASIPQLYRLSGDGQASRTPVFAKTPAWLTPDLSVVDLMDSKLVVPFNDAGEANDRETQRHKRPPELLVKYMTDYEARLADTVNGIAFQVNSASPLGVISLFERVPQGYLAVFHAEQFRALWLDAAGHVLEDVTLAGEQYSEINPYGQLATDSHGALYVLSSTETGIQVRRVHAPQ